MVEDRPWLGSAVRRGAYDRYCVRCKEYKHPRGGIAPYGKKFQCAGCRTDEPYVKRPWTTEDAQYVLANRQRKPIRMMAMELKRSVSSVRNYIERWGA